MFKSLKAILILLQAIKKKHCDQIPLTEGAKGRLNSRKLSEANSASSDASSDRVAYE